MSSLPLSIALMFHAFARFCCLMLIPIAFRCHYFRHAAAAALRLATFRFHAVAFLPAACRLRLVISPSPFSLRLSLIVALILVALLFIGYYASSIFRLLPAAIACCRRFHFASPLAGWLIGFDSCCRWIFRCHFRLSLPLLIRYAWLLRFISRCLLCQLPFSGRAAFLLLATLLPDIEAGLFAEFR